MKELKKIMTDLAAGHISQKEADRLRKEMKTPQEASVKKFKGKNTHTRKKQLKAKAGGT